MVDVRIFQPSRNVMQSGRAGCRRWILEFEPVEGKSIDPVMGWTGSADVRRQIRLDFATKEEAVAYAERQGFTARIQDAMVRRVRPKNYADNFS